MQEHKTEVYVTMRAVNKLDLAVVHQNLQQKN